MKCVAVSLDRFLTMSGFGITPKVNLLVINALIANMNNNIDKSLRRLQKNTEILTLKYAIIRILFDLPKQERVKILNELSEMYTSELITGLSPQNDL